MERRADSTGLSLARSPHWTRWFFFLVTAATVAALALRADGRGRPFAWLAAAAALAAGWLAARRTSLIARALAWGSALTLGALGSSGTDHALEAFGGVGAAVCAAAAAIALTRVPSEGGMALPVRSSAAPAVVAVLAAWLTALLSRLIPARAETLWLADHPSGWTIFAAAVSALALLVEAEWVARRRRHEIGTAERALAARSLLVTALAVSVVVGLFGPAEVGALVRTAVTLAAALAGGAVLSRDAVRVARAYRRVVVLALVGGGAALLGALAAAAGADPWVATLLTAIVALAGAAAAPALEAPLRPARGVWLDAYARASVEASSPDPDDAIRDVLLALRGPGALSSPSPELWTPAPAQWISVDAAGYLHHRAADLPDALLVAAAGEPEATLRADLLDALEVRRPDLRALAQWMSDRGAQFATIVARDGDVEGVLVLPRVARDDPPTLEELRALGAVADRLVAPCRARATQARLLARAQEARARDDASEERMQRLQHERALDAGRDALAATRLARPATVGVYGTGSRMAVEAIERRASVGGPVAVVAPSGVDPVPYIARAHLAGARRHRPLVLVDATSTPEHDLLRWNDPCDSPLALADRGMLVLLDVGALPGDVQQIVGRALSERRTPWERADPLDVQLAVTSVVPPDDLVRQGRLDPALALRLGDARTSPVVLPPLRERVEDLRCIITDRLAREGMRVLGRPVGIEHAAYARLIEHPFPGDEAELAVLVLALVARCSGDVVRARDVDAMRLSPPPALAGRHSSGRQRKSPLSA